MCHTYRQPREQYQQFAKFHFCHILALWKGVGFVSDRGLNEQAALGPRRN